MITCFVSSKKTQMCCRVFYRTRVDKLQLSIYVKIKVPTMHLPLEVMPAVSLVVPPPELEVRVCLPLV